MRERRDDFSFCFKKVGGLRLGEPNENLVRVYIKKSRSALNMLNSAIEKQENEWILDISYYAKYFIVYALFMKVGIKSEIHDCTIFALKSLFVDEGLVDKGIYDELEKSKGLRVDALYYNKEFGKEQVIKHAKVAPDFCLKVEQILGRTNEGDICRVRRKFETLRREII